MLLLVLVTSSSVSVTFTLLFVVLPLSVHSSSSPRSLYVPVSVCPNMVSFAVPSLKNSAVTFMPPCPAFHLPMIKSSGRERPQADRVRTMQANIPTRQHISIYEIVLSLNCSERGIERYESLIVVFGHKKWLLRPKFRPFQNVFVKRSVT